MFAFKEYSDFVQKIRSTPTEQKPSLPDVFQREKQPGCR